MAAEYRKFFFGFDFRWNKLKNARVNTPEHDEDIANKKYVDDNSNFIIVKKLGNIDSEYPIAKRKKGLPFFVEDAQISDGTDIVSTGQIYTFESDLTKPILLSDVSLRYVINGLTINEANYQNIITILNKTFAKLGNLVTVKPLGITFIYDGNNNWKYFAGSYNVSSVDVFNTLPNELKIVGKIVNIGNTPKIINSDYSLSDELIVVDILPTNLEEKRYYLVNGILYFVFNGTAYVLSEKIYFESSKILSIGENQIIHSLKSSNVLCFIRIYDIENIEEISNQIQMPKYRSIDVDTIGINSSFDNIKSDIIIISKF